MDGINDFLGKEVELDISGNTLLSGILIDTGLDILVLFDGIRFLYVPIKHLHSIKEKIEKEILQQPPHSLPLQSENDSVSYRKTLNNAKGHFLELFVTGNKSLHGYITNVLNDYIVFYSPVYKTLFISMDHLKWFTPYTHTFTPYTLKNEDLPVVPSAIPLARSFEEQVKKYEGKLVIFDLGDNPNKVGLLKNTSNAIVELVIANGETMFWNLRHLKMAHLP